MVYLMVQRINAFNQSDDVYTTKHLIAGSVRTVRNVIGSITNSIHYQKVVTSKTKADLKT